jgi:hypothetical protein
MPTSSISARKSHLFCPQSVLSLRVEKIASTEKRHNLGNAANSIEYRSYRRVLLLYLYSLGLHARSFLTLYSQLRCSLGVQKSSPYLNDRP